MACSQATGFWDKEAEIWVAGAGGHAPRLGRWWDQQCHGGVPTAAAPLAVGTSGTTSGTFTAAGGGEECVSWLLLPSLQ